MPRGSKPGERRGGRQRGTPNKKTALRNAAIAAAAANPERSPLDFLLGIMRDPNGSLELRIRVAQAAAPFTHGILAMPDANPDGAEVQLPAGAAGGKFGGVNICFGPVAGPFLLAPRIGRALSQIGRVQSEDCPCYP